MSKINAGMSGLDDLLFENRNKSYGAFTIRRYYNERLAVSIATTAGLLLFMWLYLQLHHNKKLIPGEVFTDGPITLTEVKIQPKIDDPTCGGAKKGEVASKISNRDTKADTTRHEEDGDGIAYKNGLPGGFGSHTFKSGPIGTFNIKNTTIINQTKKPRVPFADVVDVDAEFPGGDAALEKFVQNNFNYPNFAIENHLGGTLVMELYIDELGKIKGHKILVGLRGGFNEEAAKLVKKMPDWKPAKVGKDAIGAKRVIRLTLNSGN